jgi:hypothetical protein
MKKIAKYSIIFLILIFAVTFPVQSVKAELNDINVIFEGYDGSIIDIQTIKTPVYPELEGYTFTGWDISFDEWTGNIIFTAQYIPSQHTVTFIDFDGRIIDTQTVFHGGMAVAPNIPECEGYIFTGWDNAFDYIVEDIIIAAQYDSIQYTQYTVTFIDFDGSIIDIQRVFHGGMAITPDIPEHEEYIFTGWDRVFDYVMDDLIITAQYDLMQYTVVFIDFDGTIIDIQTVLCGESAITPNIPKHEGYIFIGWDNAFDYITSDTITTAQYSIDYDNGSTDDEYVINITWGTMKFYYRETGHWNPETHSYENIVGYWEENSFTSSNNEIIVENLSESAFSISFIPEQYDLTGIDINLYTENIEKGDDAVGMFLSEYTPNDNVPQVSAYLRLSGILSANETENLKDGEYSKVGSVAIIIAAADS